MSHGFRVFTAQLEAMRHMYAVEKNSLIRISKLQVCKLKLIRGLKHSEMLRENWQINAFFQYFSPEFIISGMVYH